MKRWTCPLCGSFILGPLAPRKDAACRYCLPCTSKTGRLVERKCLTQEAQRAAKEQRAREKAAQQAAKRKEQRAAMREQAKAPFKAAGLDLKKELRRAWARLQKSGTVATWADPPRINVQRGEGGQAWGGHGTGHIQLGKNATRDPAWGLLVLVHEMAHVVAPRGEKHGPRFWATYRRILKDAYKIEVSQTGGTKEWEHGPVLEALRGWMRAKGYEVGSKEEYEKARAAAHKAKLQKELKRRQESPKLQAQHEAAIIHWCERRNYALDVDDAHQTLVLSPSDGHCWPTNEHTESFEWGPDVWDDVECERRPVTRRQAFSAAWAYAAKTQPTQCECDSCQEARETPAQQESPCIST